MYSEHLKLYWLEKTIGKKQHIDLEKKNADLNKSVAFR